MNTESAYLMLLNIRIPQAEHAKIQERLAEISNGSAKAVYFDKNGGAFLFMSELEPKQIYDRLCGALLNDDSYIIVELGDKWITFGQGAAAIWLDKNLRK